MKEYRFRATYKDHLNNVNRHEVFTVLAANQMEAFGAADDHAEHVTDIENHWSYRLRYLGVA